MKRKYEISYMNIFLCLCVIMIHSLSELVGSFDRSKPVFICAFTLWRMMSCVVPCFIFLSGLKLSLKPQTNWKRFYLRRFTSVLIPYLIWMPIYYALSWRLGGYYESVGIREFFTMLIKGNATSHFYFIIVILQFYVMFPLWQLIVRKLPTVPVLIVCAVITALSQAWLPVYYEYYGITPFYANDRLFVNYLLPWTLGCYCGKEYERVKRFITNKRFFIYAAFIILAALDTYFAYYLSVTGIISLRIYYLNIIYCAVSALAMSAFFSAIAEKYSPGTFVVLLDKSSYYIYLSHMVVVMLVRYYMNKVGIAGLLDRFAVVALSTYVVSVAACVGYTFVKEKFSVVKMK